MSVITKSYGTPDPTQFNDQYKHKYFCEVVQGDVSNVVRQERSASVVAGTCLPTGSIGFINDKNQAVNELEGGIPYIVFVGTEHGNVFSEKYNSGCGLITMLPLHCGNDYMTTVFKGDKADFKVNAKVVLADVEIDGKTVKAIAQSTGAEGEVVVGIVRAADKHHLGCDGVVFTACYHI